MCSRRRSTRTLKLSGHVVRKERIKENVKLRTDSATNECVRHHEDVLRRFSVTARVIRERAPPLQL